MLFSDELDKLNFVVQSQANCPIHDQATVLVTTINKLTYHYVSGAVNIIVTANYANGQW